MASKNILVSLVAIFVLAFAFANVSALTSSDIAIEVNSVTGDNTAVFAGEVLPVRVTFTADENATDVVLKVWISGSREYAVSSGKFNVVAGSTYSRLVAVTVPSKVDPTEQLTLNVAIESKSETLGENSVILAAQRESYTVDILDVNLENKAQAGENLAVDVVLKNRGMQLAEDTFVKVSIPALGVEQRAYFGDMSPVDQADPNKEDASERRLMVSIPNGAKPGIYVLQVEAFNGDTSTMLTKKIAVVGSSENSMVVTSSNSKSFAVGDEATYTVTLVNSGNKIKVYDLSAESADDNLKVSLDDTQVVVPAGSSKTVKVTAVASKANRYTFSVNVNSGEELVQKQSFVANVEGSSSKAFAGSTAVVLTVILAIIFVVLLVVLIVLLTRKPEKTQEIGESYY